MSPLRAPLRAHEIGRRPWHLGESPTKQAQSWKGWYTNRKLNIAQLEYKSKFASEPTVICQGRTVKFPRCTDENIKWILPPQKKNSHGYSSWKNPHVQLGRDVPSSTVLTRNFPTPKLPSGRFSAIWAADRRERTVSSSVLLGTKFSSLFPRNLQQDPLNGPLNLGI